MIYVVLCREASAVKIGVTRDIMVHKRVSMIQGSCPLRLELVAVSDGTYGDERTLHQRFSGSRIHGEWFRLTDELSDFIATCNAPPPRRIVPARSEKLRRKWAEDSALPEQRKVKAA